MDVSTPRSPALWDRDAQVSVVNNYLDQLCQGMCRPDVEDAFVRTAAVYSIRTGVSVDAWRELGVQDDVLSRAGLE